jgi:recombinational DNA repair protein (RecF pathway)
LAIQTLDDLQTPETDFAFQPVSAILLRFELRSLQLLGHGLGLTHCAGCDVALLPPTDPADPLAIEHLSNRRNRQLFFSWSDTSLVCGTCHRGRGRTIEFSQRAAQVLRLFQDEDDRVWRRHAVWGRHPVFRDLMDGQWQALLNRRLRLTPAIRQLVKKENREA